MRVLWLPRDALCALSALSLSLTHTHTHTHTHTNKQTNKHTHAHGVCTIIAVHNNRIVKHKISTLLSLLFRCLAFPFISNKRWIRSTSNCKN